MSDQPSLSRREFVALTAAGLAATTVIGQVPNAVRTYAYVGCWAQGTNGFGTGGGGGISQFEVNTDHSLRFMSKLGPEFDDMNAGYLAISADGRYLYSTEEVGDLQGDVGAGGGLMSFTINPEDGSLTHLNTQPSMGVNPSYLIIDHTGKLLLTSNHGGYGAATRVVFNKGIPEVEKVFDDGTVTLLPLNADGSIAPATDVAILERVGGVPGLQSQRSSHAHSISFDPSNEHILVCDKGSDRIYSYRLNREKKTLEDEKYLQVEPGVAPRHSVFHPRAPFVFVSYEIVPRIASFHFDSDTGEIQHIETVSTVPSSYRERTNPSDIKLHPNGKFLYTANRGHNSVAIHRIDESNGTMEVIDIVPSGGSGPRGLTFDSTGNYLLIANQGSNQVSTFLVNPETGHIAPTGAAVDLLRPACIKLLQL